MAEDTTDEVLVSRAVAGDLSAFEELVHRHGTKVYAFALRIVQNTQDAEDVTQQAFLSAMEHLAGFRRESSFGTWIIRIASHAALKVLRKRKGAEVFARGETSAAGEDHGVPHPEFIADWRQRPDELVHQREIRRLLDDALAELDDKHRLVFVLRDVQGLSIQETAEVLKLSEANVKVRLLRARLQLRERLTRVLGDPAVALQKPHHV